MSVYPTSLVAEQRVGGIDFSSLPWLASGRNLNLTSNDMVDLRHQGITVDDENYPSAENIPDGVPQPLNSYNCKPEGTV